VAVEKIDIASFLTLAESHPVFDVRSPGEYAHAHMPGAGSLPLFTDEERKVVGTAYKQESREKAIKIGLDYFGPNMRQMVEKVERLAREFAAQNKHDSSNTVLLYCWRGGMRSAAVAWLLDLYGFKIYTLAGGYKTFRNHVHNSFKTAYRFNILGGYTGSGKTEVLNELTRLGEPVVDLEAIAVHKGSAFGNIGLPPQPTQEMFENLLAGKLISVQEKITDDPEARIWMEDESQRIGLINLPKDLWETMRNSPLFFLDIDFESRLEHIVKGYGDLDREKVAGAINRIQKRLGNNETKMALQFLEEDDIVSCFRILLKYYDKYYLKGLHNREALNSLLIEIKCEELGPQNAGLLLQKA
jgi:tRNA 2-selenouridine synthase